MDNSIIDKIQKLLARGDADRNDNEHERTIAMRQAHSLLAKHGLSMADISEAEQTEATGALGRQSVEIGRYVWQSGVYGQIAKLHGCAIIRESRRGKQTVWLIGRHLHCEIAKNMAAYICHSIAMQAAREGHNITQFGTGAWNGLAQQVRDILANMAQGKVNGEQLSTGTAMVLVNQHHKALTEAQDTLRSFWPHTTKGGTYRSRGGDSYSAGHNYGRKVGLNKQVNGHGTLRIGN